MTREAAQGDDAEEADDLDDLDDADEVEDDGEPEEKTEIVGVRRLSSIDAWEMYAVRDEDDGEPIASIAISAPRNGARAVDYAVWRTRGAQEPSFTGSLHRKGDSAVPATEWSDAAREEVLRQVFHHHEADLGVKQDKLDFRLAPRAAGDDDESDDEPEDES
jgi:hypothetical protein